MTTKNDDSYSKNNKELKRIDWGIVKRIMTLLHQHNGIKKTNLAMKCNLSYDKCILYLNWLEIVDFVSKENDEKCHQVIMLTERGKELYHRKFKIEDNTKLASAS